MDFWITRRCKLIFEYKAGSFPSPFVSGKGMESGRSCNGVGTFYLNVPTSYFVMTNFFVARKSPASRR